MKIEVRPICKELDPFIAGFAYGFQQIDCYGLAPEYLCRNAEFHGGIVRYYG